MNIMDFLASVLNPNPGQNRMVNPNLPAHYQTQTGLSPDQVARFHQQSGIAQPQAAPSAAVAPQQAQQPDQQQTASVAAPQAEGGGLLSRLFGGGQSAGENQTIQWLQQQGMDPGTATMMARSKPALQQYLLKRSQGVDPKDALQTEKLGLEIEQLRHPAADKPPTSYQEFQLAKQDGSFKGDFTEWQTKGTRDRDPSFDREDQLRSKYDADPNTLVYKKVRDSYERVRTAVGNPSGPDDIGIIYGYMKMLDPGSNVMEGERATAENAGGVAQSIINQYNKALTGEFLADPVRQQFLSASRRLYAEAASNLGDTNKRYEGIATGWELDPTRIVQMPEQYEDITPPPAQVGGLPLPPPPGGAPVSSPPPAAPGGDVSSMPPPEGISPEVWKHVPPEKRKLWAQ